MRHIATSLLMMIVAVVVAILLITWFWPIINGLFWTVVLGALLGYIAMLTVQHRIQNMPGRGLFQQTDAFGWSLVAGVIVFLIVLVIGFSITMTIWNSSHP